MNTIISLSHKCFCSISGFNKDHVFPLATQIVTWDLRAKSSVSLFFLTLLPLQFQRAILHLHKVFQERIPDSLLLTAVPCREALGRQFLMWVQKRGKQLFYLKLLAMCVITLIALFLLPVYVSWYVGGQNSHFTDFSVLLMLHKMYIL